MVCRMKINVATFIGICKPNFNRMTVLSGNTVFQLRAVFILLETEVEIMLSVQHVMCLYEKNMQASNRLVAATVYPDAVRAYTGSRQYSHFERAYDNSDVSYMRFSSDMAITQDEMKAKLLTKCHLANSIKACAIGEDTDIDAFYKHNARLEYVMKAGI